MKITSVTYALTNNCNLNCIWCFQNAVRNIKEKNTKQDLEEKKTIIDKISLSSKKLTLSGGEPFTYPYILNLLDYCINKFEYIGITTNLLALNDEHYKYLSAREIPLIVSIDGINEIHEKIRGKGTYNKLISAIHKCKKMQIKIYLQMTVSKLNYNCVDDIIELSSTLRVNVAFQRFIPLGRGALFENLKLSPHELKILGEKINLLEENNLTIKVRSKDPIHKTQKKSTKVLMEKYPNCIVGGCKAGMGYLFIQSDGTVLSCPFINVPLGNIFTEDLDFIAQHSDFLKQLKNQSAYNENCKSCKGWYRCRGCRAYAGIGGDYMSEDPLCWK